MRELRKISQLGNAIAWSVFLIRLSPKIIGFDKSRTAWGAADEKHVAVVALTNFGSRFYNCKHFSSVVIMAVVDFFIYVDVGAYRRCSDGDFANSTFGAAILDNSQEEMRDEGENGLKYFFCKF